MSERGTNRKIEKVRRQVMKQPIFDGQVNNGSFDSIFPAPSRPPLKYETLEQNVCYNLEEADGIGWRGR